MAKYTVSKSFNSSVERSARVLEVSEAFGLGLSDKEFVIYDGLEVEIKEGDVCYITGQSGSGKSLLMRHLSESLANDGGRICDIDAIEYDERPLIDQIGATMSDAIRLLSLAGLNDAYLFVRKPSELSDGQKYRFRLAKVIESDADVWVADEFTAALDRVTAKVVAFNLQKVARKLNKTVMVATTHMDLKDELAPNLYVEKYFRDKIEVNYELDI